MESILDRVKSPFSNEFIAELLLKYISVGGDIQTLYDYLNNSGTDKKNEDIINFAYQLKEAGHDSQQFKCETNKYWCVIFGKDVLTPPASRSF